MPWRLVQFVVVFMVFLVFIIFNLENKCDISFGFTNISEVPVFITAFFSFIAGMLCTIPFILGLKFRKKNKDIPKEEKPVKPDGDQNAENVNNEVN